MKKAIVAMLLMAVFLLGGGGLFLGTDMLKLFQKKIVYHKITYLYCTAAGDSLQLQIRTLFRSKTVLPHLLFV